MKTKLNIKRSSVLLLLVSYLITVCFSGAVSKPNWLTNGLYMTYEQVFLWNTHTEIANMTWQITQVEDTEVNIYLTSHTINESDGALNIILVPNNLTINADNREIINSSESNMIGNKWFFWIDTDVNVGSEVDAGYGVARISGSESISVLGQKRDTWIVEYNWYTSQMKRWYDKVTGIVLKIDVAMENTGIPVQVTETSKWTNINLPSSEVGSNLPIWLLPLSFALIVSIVLIGAAAFFKTKKRMLKSENLSKAV